MYPQSLNTAEQAGETSSTNLKTYSCLSYWGTLSKCITRADILQFGKRHLKRLQAKGLFPYGLPSEATLCRVFQSIDDEKMAERMSAFAEFSVKRPPLRQRTSFASTARPCEVPCTRTDVTPILYLHIHSVRVLLWLLMFARRKVMKFKFCDKKTKSKQVKTK